MEGQELVRALDARDEAREEAELRRALADVDPDGIVVIDDSSVILAVNPMMEKIFGYPAEELIGEALTMLVPERLREMHYRGIERYLSTGTRSIDWLGVQLPGCRRDGEEIDLEINFGEYDVDGSHRFVGFVRDITTRKRIEEALQSAKEEAERANLAKSEFLSRMSHELRTPLNSILGFGQVLERQNASDEQRKSIDHIMRAGRHLLSLIDEVLDIARIEANRQQFSLESVHLGEVLEEALALIRPVAEKRSIGIPETIPGGLDAHVHTDRQRLMQVILNLLSNAVKYNREGGRVELLAADESVADLDGLVAFGVRDTGRGISADQMDELFVPFARLGADERGIEGTGLGLALSRHLVEAMSGELRVESAVGSGSTFWVAMPLASDPAEALARHRGSGSGVDRKESEEALQILYVEDNLANFHLVESIFEDRPEIQLLAAMQGRLGIEFARQHGPSLILLDLHLPDMKGEEVLRELLADRRTSDIPIIVISADATPRQRERLERAGVRGYLTKPLDIDEFLAEVDIALNGPA